MAGEADGGPLDLPALEAVTEAIVALHERYHGRRPLTARTQMLGDDMLACVLGEVYTDVEKTMIELQCGSLVEDTRRAFQLAMGQRFVDAVERVTHRSVARFISAHHVGPDLEIALFLLEPRAGPAQCYFWGQEGRRTGFQPDGRSSAD